MSVVEVVNADNKDLFNSKNKSNRPYSLTKDISRNYTTRNRMIAGTIANLAAVARSLGDEKSAAMIASVGARLSKSLRDKYVQQKAVKLQSLGLTPQVPKKYRG